MKCLGSLLGKEIFLPLGVLVIVVKYPSVCGGDPPMVVFTCLVTVMSLDWYWMLEDN